MDSLGKYRQVVIWGLRGVRHTHRYIHSHFAATLAKLRMRHCWLDDRPENQAAVGANDLVISINVAGKHLPKVPGTDYCLHNFDEIGRIHEELDPRHNVRLQVYTSPAERATEQWGSATYFDPPTRTLYQPWGTDLLAAEFKTPTYSRVPLVFWIGSVWNNELNQGNIKEIAELRNALGKRRLRLIHLQGIPDWGNVRAVRMSRIAPAIGGRWQVENNYLPCRMFKNISYGQLGLSNVGKFHDLMPTLNPVGGTIDELVEAALSLPQSRYVELTRAQQDAVRQHTYREKLANIVRALERVK